MGIQMNRKELAKTFMMTSNFQNGLYNTMSSLWGLNHPGTAEIVQEGPQK